MPYMDPMGGGVTIHDVTIQKGYAGLTRPKDLMIMDLNVKHVNVNPV